MKLKEKRQLSDDTFLFELDDGRRLTVRCIRDENGELIPWEFTSFDMSEEEATRIGLKIFNKFF